MKLQQKADNQYMLTVPLNFVKGMGWKGGDELQFEFLSKDKLAIRKIEPEVKS